MSNNGFTPTKNTGGNRQFNLEGLMSSPRDNFSSKDKDHYRKRSNDTHISVALNNAMTNHDLAYFEEMIEKYYQDLQKPLMQRRAEVMKDDLVEEIEDLYNEIKETEKNFKKVIEVTRKSLLLKNCRIHDKQEQGSI